MNLVKEASSTTSTSGMTGPGEEAPAAQDRRSSSSSRARSQTASRSASYSPSPSRSTPQRSRSRSPDRAYRGVSRSQSPSTRAPPDRRGTRHNDDGLYSVQVSGLTRMVLESHLEHMFGQYGRIREVILPAFRRSGENKGNGWLVFESTASARKAEECMDGGQVDGAVVSVRLAPIPTSEQGRDDGRWNRRAADNARRPYMHRGNYDGSYGWRRRGRDAAYEASGQRSPPRRRDYYGDRTSGVGPMR